jgi:hypothetical protein
MHRRSLREAIRLMPMALDVVARLGLATDDAKATNFAGLCCRVTESAIAGAPRAIRKGRRLSKMFTCSSISKVLRLFV